MTANFGNPEGILEWSSLSYTRPNSAIIHWDYDLFEGISVGMIYLLIICNGRDRYRMSGGGSGCRFWV